jgi:hypothetical protein
MNDFKGFSKIDGEVGKITHTAKQVDGEGFSNMVVEKVQEHTEDH